MDRLRLTLAWLASLVYWVIGGLIFLLLAVALPWLLEPDRARVIAQKILSLSFRGFARLLRFFDVVECDYEGFERVREAKGPLILAPNHPALWDAVFVLAGTEGMACVLKAGLMNNPLLYGGATAAGFIPNEPAHKMLRLCIETLKREGRLLYFPEGTRTRPEHGLLNPFHGGIGIVAKNSGAPVWPVHVRTNSRYLCKGWPLWRLPDGKIRVHMSVGEPVSFPSGGDIQAFLDDLHARHLAALEKPAA